MDELEELKLVLLGILILVFFYAINTQIEKKLNQKPSYGFKWSFINLFLMIIGVGLIMYLIASGEMLYAESVEVFYFFVALTLFVLSMSYGFYYIFTPDYIIRKMFFFITQKYEIKNIQSVEITFQEEYRLSYKTIYFEISLYDYQNKKMLSFTTWELNLKIIEMLGKSLRHVPKKYINFVDKKITLPDYTRTYELEKVRMMVELFEIPLKYDD